MHEPVKQSFCIRVGAEFKSRRFKFRAEPLVVVHFTVKNYRVFAAGGHHGLVSVFKV